MFWNGVGWIDDRSATPLPPRAPRPYQRHPIRDLIATLPIVLLVPALVIPLHSVHVAAVTPSGSSMPKHEWIQGPWNGSQSLINVRTAPDAHASVTFTILTSANVGADTNSATAAIEHPDTDGVLWVVVAVALAHALRMLRSRLELNANIEVAIKWRRPRRGPSSRRPRRRHTRPRHSRG